MRTLVSCGARAGGGIRAPCPPALPHHCRASPADRPAREDPGQRSALGRPCAMVQTLVLDHEDSCPYRKQDAPARSAPAHSPLTRRAPAHSAPALSVPARSTPTRTAPAHSTPARSAPAHRASACSAPDRRAPARSAPARSAPAHSPYPQCAYPQCPCLQCLCPNASCKHRTQTCSWASRAAGRGQSRAASLYG